MSYEYLVIQSLQEDVERHINDIDILDEESFEVFESALTLLRYYMTSTQYQQWYSPRAHRIEKVFAECSNDKKYAEVTDVVDNPDGSADIEFEMNDGMKKIVMNEGVNMMLIKGILNCTTDELLQLAQGGEENEEKECLVKGCPNKSTQGRFVGDLCCPCYNMLSEGKVRPSMAWFAKENSEMKKKLERISNVL